MSSLKRRYIFTCHLVVLQSAAACLGAMTCSIIENDGHPTFGTLLTGAGVTVLLVNILMNYLQSGRFDWRWPHDIQ